MILIQDATTHPLQNSEGASKIQETSTESSSSGSQKSAGGASVTESTDDDDEEFFADDHDVWMAWFGDDEGETEEEEDEENGEEIDPSRATASVSHHFTRSPNHPPSMSSRLKYILEKEQAAAGIAAAVAAIPTVGVAVPQPHSTYQTFQQHGRSAAGVAAVTNQQYPAYAAASGFRLAPQQLLQLSHQQPIVSSHQPSTMNSTRTSTLYQHHGQIGPIGTRGRGNQGAPPMQGHRRTSTHQPQVFQASGQPVNASATAYNPVSRETRPVNAVHQLQSFPSHYVSIIPPSTLVPSTSAVSRHSKITTQPQVGLHQRIVPTISVPGHLPTLQSHSSVFPARPVQSVNPPSGGPKTRGRGPGNSLSPQQVGSLFGAAFAATPNLPAIATQQQAEPPRRTYPLYSAPPDQYTSAVPVARQ